MIPKWGRSPGEGNGNPLQYSCLENSWTEEPGRLQFLGSQRVRHDWVTNTFQWIHVYVNVYDVYSVLTGLCSLGHNYLDITVACSLQVLGWSDIACDWSKLITSRKEGRMWILCCQFYISMHTCRHTSIISKYRYTWLKHECLSKQEKI